MEWKVEQRGASPNSGPEDQEVTEFQCPRCGETLVIDEDGLPAGAECPACRRPLTEADVPVAARSTSPSPHSPTHNPLAGPPVPGSGEGTTPRPTPSPLAAVSKPADEGELPASTNANPLAAANPLAQSAPGNKLGQVELTPGCWEVGPGSETPEPSPAAPVPAPSDNSTALPAVPVPATPPALPPPAPAPEGDDEEAADQEPADKVDDPELGVSWQGRPETWEGEAAGADLRFCFRHHALPWLLVFGQTLAERVGEEPADLAEDWARRLLGDSVELAEANELGNGSLSVYSARALTRAGWLAIARAPLPLAVSLVGPLDDAEAMREPFAQVLEELVLQAGAKASGASLVPFDAAFGVPVTDWERATEDFPKYIAYAKAGEYADTVALADFNELLATAKADDGTLVLAPETDSGARRWQTVSELRDSYPGVFAKVGTKLLSVVMLGLSWGAGAGAVLGLIGGGIWGCYELPLLEALGNALAGIVFFVVSLFAVPVGLFFLSVAKVLRGYPQIFCALMGISGLGAPLIGLVGLLAAVVTAGLTLLAWLLYAGGTSLAAAAVLGGLGALAGKFMGKRKLPPVRLSSPPASMDLTANPS